MTVGSGSTSTGTIPWCRIQTRKASRGARENFTTGPKLASAGSKKVRGWNTKSAKRSCLANVGTDRAALKGWTK